MSHRLIARIFLKVSMDYHVDLDPTHSAIRVTVTAAVLTHELVDDCYRSVVLAASHDGPYCAIWDLSGVMSTTVSADDIRNLALTAPGIPAGVRPRVVVAKKPVVYGLSRMLELYRESMGGLLKVVQSMEEAYAMLGVRPEDFTERLFP